jgi:membrane protease YdiL (CAAX protease family)
MKQIPGSNQSFGKRYGLLVILQSILIGFLVSSAGIAVWSLLLLKIATLWSVVPMVFALCAYLKWFSGSWVPKSLQAARRLRFRLTRLSPVVWKWSLIAALLFVVIVQAGFFITFRIFEFPGARFTSDYKMLDSMPVVNAWALIVMSSVVAGICEETGFRGYMQLPLERKFGPSAGIIITSVMFTLIHLSHSWAAPILPHIFFASVLLGILAFRSGSIIPGIMGHSILDIFDYGIWWSNITGGFNRKTIFVTGIDLHFIVSGLAFSLAIFAFFRSIRKIRNETDLVSRFQSGLI